MIRGVGIDLLDIARMERILGREHFMTRVFTASERERIGRGPLSAQTAAGIFCAKEACAKAMGKGLGGLRFQEVSVEKIASGQPYLVFSGGMAGQTFRAHLSISHSGGSAVAVVVLEDEA